MSKVLIIGAGGVGGVVTHKCAAMPEVFSHITLASRTLARCENIRRQVKELRGRDIDIARVDADDVSQTVKVIRQVKPKLVINVAMLAVSGAVLSRFVEQAADRARDGVAVDDLGPRILVGSTAGLALLVAATALSDYLSGLLIGAEVAEATLQQKGAVTIIASAALAQRYTDALRLLGYDSALAPEDCVAAGHWRIAQAAGLV